MKFSTVVTTLIVSYSFVGIVAAIVHALRCGKKHRNLLLGFCIVLCMVRVACFSLAFSDTGRKPMPSDILDTTPSMLYFSILTIYFYRVYEDNTFYQALPHAHLIPRLNKLGKILIACNSFSYITFMILFWIDSLLETFLSRSMVQVTATLFLGIIFFCIGVAISLVLLKKRREYNTIGFPLSNRTAYWMLFVCGIIVVVCCIFRSILLLLPTTCIESDADEGGGHRFTLIDDYYHDPDDFTKSFAWLLVYYLSGEVVPCFVQVITYHWLPSSSSRFENKGIPLAEKEIAPQNTHAAENVVRKLLQGEVHSSITSIPWEEIILGPKIGTGAAGIVYQAKFRGLRVAVKQIEVDLRASDHQELRSFCQEISIMAKLRHPNICQFIGVSLTRNLGDESVPFNIALIMEFVELGSLSDVLKKQRDLSFDKRMRIAREIALGMNYLHCNNPTVLHRDFKASNIFITSDLHAKIGDFGFSSLRRDAFSFSGSQNFMTSLSIEDVSEFGGTLEYMAPELLALPGANKIHYTPKCDVYSYGVVLWELATQLELFAGMEKGEIITFVVDRKARLPIPPSVPSQIRNLISACWHHDPNNRPKFQQILTDLTNFLGM